MRPNGSTDAQGPEGKRAIQANAGPWSPAHIGLLLIGAVVTSSIYIAVNTEIPGTLLCAVMLLVWAAVLLKRSTRLGLLNHRALAVALTIALLLAMPPVLIIRASRAAETEFERDVAQVVAFKGSAAQLANLLHDSDSSVLEMAARRGSDTAQQEVDRRLRAARASQRAKAETLEKRNQAQIAGVLAQLKDTIPEQAEERLFLYKRLIALAPANASYRAEAGKIQAHLDDLQNRIDHPAANIDMLQQGWRKGGFGSVFLLRAKLKNTGTRPWKDFEVTCQVQAPSGTVIQSLHGTIFEVLKPGEVRTFRDVNLGLISQDAAGVGCDITGAAPA